MCICLQKIATKVIWVTFLVPHQWWGGHYPWVGSLTKMYETSMDMEKCNNFDIQT